MVQLPQTPFGYFDTPVIDVFGGNGCRIHKDRFSLLLSAMLTDSQVFALDKITQAAVQAELQTTAPAQLSSAQAILESSWLSAAPGNNCFGIRATDDHLTYCLTKEYVNGTWQACRESFESYPTLADCFIAHAKLIQGGRYTPFWDQYRADRDLDSLIRGICPIYASDPQYTEEILVLSHGPHVMAAIERARQQANQGAPVTA
jgi:flagellum-specific peptidoglycan hydrolase FlgJ